MSASVAGKIIQKSLDGIFPSFETILAPIADGGDGTCQLLSSSLKLETSNVWTLDALGRPILGFYGWDRKNKIAYLDSSTASGISSLSREQLFPTIASSFGTGILIKHAIGNGAKEIVLGLGGSATIDLGVGILAALWLEFLDNKGRELPVYSPGFLKSIAYVQRKPNKIKVRFTCLCDVKNFLLGSTGTVPIFGPQKGVSQNEIEEWETVIKSVIETIYRKSNQEFVDQKGFGAAGGIAAGLNAFFDTIIEFGATYFFEKTDLKEKVTWCDWIITGEGRYDSQSVGGKACYELLQLARRGGKKIILITSGNEVETNEFDHIIRLQELELNGTTLNEIAEYRLKNLLDIELPKIFN